MRRSCAWSRGVACALGAVLLLACAAVLPAVGAADESVTVTGSITYTWQGDPARGCAAVGVCDVQGAMILRPQGQAEVHTFGRTTQIELATVGPTVRVLIGNATCVDIPPGAEFSSLFITQGANRRPVVQVEPPLSSGRCPGPLQQDLAALSLVVRRSGGKRPSFDLRTDRSFAAGPFSGNLVSTLVLRPGGGGGFESSSYSAVAQGPPPSGPHTVLVERVRLRYRLASLRGTLAMSFSGDPGPFCAGLESCGATGTLQLGIPGFRDTLVLDASRVVSKPVGARQAVADFRHGRLALDLGQIIRSGGRVPTQVTETFRAQDGSRCQDTSTSRDAQLFFAPKSLRAGSGLSVTLSDATGVGLLRTYCPGPTDVDVIGSTGRLAGGSVGLAELLRRQSVVSLANTGGFDGFGYAGTRSGAIAMSLSLTGVRGGTVQETR